MTTSSQACVLYCRVSSREQEETGYSLPSQEKLLSEYAERKEFRITKIFSVAESASGSKQRQVFGEMIAFMEANKIPHLLCEKVDRLTRNLKEAVVANDWVEADEARAIHFVKQNLVIHKNAKSDEKFRWDIEIVLAKKYISNLSEEVKKGQKEKIAQGWLPTKPPIGYRTVGDKGHKTHVIDEDKAPFIRKAFEYYASGNYSLMALRDRLFEDGLRTRGGFRLAKGRLDDILNDPFYYGAIRWKDVIYNRGAQTPLISKELFDRVKQLKARKNAPAYGTKPLAFRKMMKCGECSGTITGEIQKGIVYYHCNHYRACSQKKYSPEQKIEQQLFDVFKFFESITSKEAEQIKAKIKANHAQETEYKETTIRTLTERYSALQRRLDVLYDDRLDERITVAYWEIKQKEITTEQADLQAQLTRLKSDEAQYFEIWLNILDLATRAREIYEKRSPEERRMLLTHIFSNLMLKDEKVLYTLTKPVAKLAERVQQQLDLEKTFEPKKSGLSKRQKDSFESLRPALLRG